MPTCTVCEHHEVDAAYACPACVADLARSLGDVARHAQDAQDAADGLARYGTPGPSHGGDEGRTPINLGATGTLATATTAVTTWARHVADERGLDVPTPDRRPVHGPGCPVGWCQHGSCRSARTRTAEHPVATAALWLVDQLGWLAHRREIAEAHPDLRTAAQAIARLADRPPEQVLVGVCECGQWLYARPGRRIIRCRGCAQPWNVEESRDILRRAMDDKLLTAAQIATLAARAGHDRRKVRNLVNQWGSRGVLEVRGHDGEAPQYRLGDALDRLARHATTPTPVAG